jgi:hypothetical protein
MKPHRILILFLLLATVVYVESPACAQVPSLETSARAEVAASAPTVRDLIPVGAVPVAVMNVAVPPRLQELVQRFQAAVQSDPAWLLEYTKENDRPGEPLPYHPKMGVSEVEYKEMLSLMKEMRMVTAAKAEITVRAEPNGRFTFDGGHAVPELTGISIDLEKNRVETPFGTTTTTNEIKPSPEQKVTGPWSGVSWKREEFNMDTMTGTVVQFNIGRLQESGRGILYYNAKRAVNGSNEGSAFQVLTYDLPTAKLAKP